MADFGKRGGKSAAPVSKEIVGGTPVDNGFAAPKSVPESEKNTKNPGTRGSNRGWQ